MSRLTSPSISCRARRSTGRPSIGILFYRAHWMSGNLLPIDALIRSLEAKGANVLPVYAFSLKHSPEGDGVANRAFTEYLAAPDGTPRVHCIVNTMGMSMGELSNEGPAVASGWSVDYLDSLNVPMLQAIVSTGTEEEWLESDLGLGPIDTAMSVALPEFDGRLISVPISFKEEVSAGPEPVAIRPAQGEPGRTANGVSGRLQRYVPRDDRVELVARLAIKQANLALKPNSEKKIAVILSNYPTKDARIGNAVGLDTPNSAILVLNALRAAGYQVTDIPETGDELVHRIIERCSNDRDSLTEEQLRLAAGHVTAKQYGEWFATFPEDVVEDLSRDWGEPPGQVYRTAAPPVPKSGGGAHNSALAIAGIDLGNVFVGCSRRAGSARTPSPSTTAPIWLRRTITSPTIAGSATYSAPTPSCTWASTARWSGCRARASACRRPATPKWPWTTCRYSTRSSSTTPARDPRPSGAPTPPSSTT